MFSKDFILNKIFIVMEEYKTENNADLNRIKNSAKILFDNHFFSFTNLKKN